ncbi:MAG: hypothetical protein AABW51_01325 [Nanoarchaeota archaeon]
MIKIQEKDNVLRIFVETKEAITKEDAMKLNELSNQTIHSASITQDPDNIAVAVIIYSLSKIIERKNYRGYNGWGKFYRKIVDCIDHSTKALEDNDDDELRVHIKSLRNSIDNLSGKLKIYIHDVFRKASINKASRIYEHGISLEKTAGLLGITLYELASYAGGTGIPDVSLSKTMDVKNRIKIAMEFFE